MLTGEPIAGGKLFYNLVPPPMLLSDGPARHRRDDHRFAGADFRRLFAGLASDPVGSVSATQPPAHPSSDTPVRSTFPFVNWSLFVGCILLVVAFGSSAALAAAYGLAVSGVMVITSMAMFPIARVYWKWGPARTGLVWGSLTGGQRRFPDREFAQVPRRRLRSAFGRRRFVPGDGDLAVGPQGDLRGLYRQVHDDDGRARGAASRVRRFHGAKRRGDGGKLGAPADRSRACDCPDAVGAARHPAAQPDHRRR